MRLDPEKEPFCPSCSDGPVPSEVSLADSRQLAERHAFEHRESINLVPKKMGVSSETSEVRIVDPITGGEKGSKLARFSLIPGEFLWALATHYGKGARKYAERNWERGYSWNLSWDALQRHLEAWRGGESIDAETGSNHLIAAAWHCVALFIFELRSLGTDDLRSRRKE